jgi:transposase-like protein
MDATKSVGLHDPHPFGPPLTRCPECGSSELQPIVEGDIGEVHFLCGNCGRCWHVELGYVRAVTTQWCRD